MKLDSLKKESILDIRKKFSSFFLKVGWILMFVGTPIGSGIGALPFLLAGRLLKGDLKIKKDTLFLLTNLFLLTLPISILNAKRKLFAFWWVIAFGLTLYLVLFGAKYLIKEKYFLNKLAIIFIVCSVVSSIYGLTIYFSRLDCRTHTLFANPNEFGTILIPALIITLAFFTQTPGKGKILLGGGLSLILTSLFFSFSRGAWLGAIVALLVYGVYQRKDLLKVIILIAIIIIALFSYSPLLDRLRSISDFSYPSNAQRILIWKTTLEIIKDYPLTGVGMGEYPLFFSKYKPGVNGLRIHPHAHNIFLQIWVEAGIGALVFFIVIIILILKRGIKLLKYESTFSRLVSVVSFASFIGMLTQNQVDCTIYSIHIGPFFFLLAGIIFYGEKLALKIKDKIQENAK